MSYRSTVLLDNPDWYGRLSETGAGPLVDVVGAHNATPNVTIVTGASLLKSDVDAGITLDRNTGFTIGQTTYPLAQTPMTIEFWIKTSSLTGPAYCCSSNDANTGWTVSYANASGNWSVKPWPGAAWDFSSGVTSGVAQHAVFVLSATNDCTYYRNGAFVQTLSGGGSMISTSVGLAIGNATSGPQGIVDEFAIYKSALPGYRIAAHYAAGVAGQVLTALGAGV